MNIDKYKKPTKEEFRKSLNTFFLHRDYSVEDLESFWNELQRIKIKQDAKAAGKLYGQFYALVVRKLEEKGEHPTKREIQNLIREAKPTEIEKITNELLELLDDELSNKIDEERHKRLDKRYVNIASIMIFIGIFLGLPIYLALKDTVWGSNIGVTLLCLGTLSIGYLIGKGEFK